MALPCCREGVITRLSIVGLLLFVTLLASCKLIIVVPKGGEVISKTGQKNCAQGKTCPWNIVDLFFIDTFTAKPAPGYRFKQWKKRELGLCGGKGGPCQLYTAPLRGNPALISILESDVAFYLEPVFEKSSATDEGPVSKQNASACYNSDLGRTGNTLNLKYSSRDKISGDVTVAVTNQTTLGPSQFKGKPAIESRSETSIPAAQVTSVSNNFFTVDDANSSTTNLGGTGATVVRGNPSGSINLEFLPGVKNRLNLGAGQKFSQTYTTKTTNNIGGRKFTSSLTQEVVTTYIGVVSIAVAAGNYQACKFLESSTGKSAGIPFTSSRTYWIAVGLGIQVKEDNESSISELVSGSIDDRPI